MYSQRSPKRKAAPRHMAPLSAVLLPLAFWNAEDASKSLNVVLPPGSPPAPVAPSPSPPTSGISLSIWPSTNCTGEIMATDYLSQEEIDDMNSSACSPLRADFGSGEITVYESFACDADSNKLETRIHKLKDCSDAAEQSCFREELLDALAKNNGTELPYGCSEALGGPNRALGMCLKQLDSMSVTAEGNFTCPGAAAWYTQRTSQPAARSLRSAGTHASNCHLC